MDYMSSSSLLMVQCDLRETSTIQCEIHTENVKEKSQKTAKRRPRLLQIRIA
jgi:hypothetical protein